MPYDQYLAERIRHLLSRTKNVTEREMMGGLCFMVDGKMCINVTSRGNVMQRCLPNQTEEVVKKHGASRFIMNGKPLNKGWLTLAPEAMDSDDDLQYWINIALAGNKEAKSKSRSGK
ncbi:TfoX/Sxy family protein [Mucilaginibacter ginkgonis]|uniref:TfoX/Sxy family protein n=1 Tax=Mucilaginibacter ginkgonis TaxID=2682091 RepID=A0A6I4I2J2_9SPHI|nr:TfoX/Sxy family protein [Mucilaginibacter ginkgonis]QQL49163.1 TfoX/Sxy family protein [Mucilaginibacter ginkgonis]